MSNPMDNSTSNTKRPFERERVYRLVDEEIEFGKKKYDEKRPPGTPPDAEKSVLEYICLMEEYLAHARTSGCKGWPKKEALQRIKAVAGFATNCLMYHYDELVKKEPQT